MKRALSLGSLLVLAACERALSFGALSASTVDAGQTGDPDAAIAMPSPFGCDTTGPLVLIADAEGVCGAASSGFHYAVCGCGPLISEADLRVDGFDSRRGGYAPGQASGSLALNGALFARLARFGGSLVVAGTEGIPLSGDLSVGGHLSDRGQLQGQHAVAVGGDARIAGDVRVASLAVGGTLRLAERSALEVGAGAPPAQRTSIAVDPPCRCDAPLDIAALVDAARTDNDNTTTALPLDAQRALRVFAPLEATLPCGRYYIEDLYAGQPLTLRITGRVALYVNERVTIDANGSLTLALEGSAELDVFVVGGMSASGPVEIGDARAPSRVRLHFGGGRSAGENVFFGARSRVSGSLYAPRSQIVTKGPFELFGAALVQSFSASEALTLHYDRALASDSCSEARCTRDEDCAEGLRCDGQACLP